MENIDFDFSKPEDQAKFDQLPKEEKDRLIEDAHEEALEEEKKRENLKEGSFLIERLRARTPESIESFDINEEGLAVHGSKLSNLESILTNGLDQSGGFGLTDKVKPINVWYNVIGHPASDEGRQTRIGFGSEKVMFGGEIVFVTDIFKKMWPNIMNGMVKLPPVITGNGGVFGEIEISHEKYGTNSYDPEKCRITLWGIDSYDCNWVDLKEIPEPEKLLIPEFNKESSIVNPKGSYVDGKWLDTGEKVKTFKIEDPYDTKVNQKAFRQLLSARTINAIVISDKIPRSKSSDEPTLTHEQMLENIIATQNKLLPREEQIPVYNEQGECLYNPLES